MLTTMLYYQDYKITYIFTIGQKFNFCVFAWDINISDKHIRVNAEEDKLILKSRPL